MMTTPKRILRNSRSLLGIMSSIKYLRDNGATKLEALLTIINAKPIKTRFLLGQMMVLNAFRILTLLSDIGDLAIFY
jgi:hypothetical protein